jgi:hypothetical protein
MLGYGSPFVSKPTTVIPTNGSKTKRGQNNEASDSSQAFFVRKSAHDNKNLRTPKFKNNHRRPHCLEEGKRRLQQAIKDNFVYSGFTAIFFHLNKRKRRSEMRETCISLLLSMILHTVNLHKMYCGYYDDNNVFRYHDFDYFKKNLEISRYQMFRAISDLKKNEYIQVEKIKGVNKNGELRTLGVKILVTEKIFHDLEIYDEFLKDRESATRKFHFREQKIINKRKSREVYSFKQAQKTKHNLKIQSSIDVKKSMTSVAKKVRDLYQKKDHGKTVNDRIKEIMYTEGLSLADAMAKAKKEFYPTTDPP